MSESENRDSDPRIVNSDEQAKAQGHDPSEAIPKADDFSVKRERSQEAEALMDPKGVFMLGVRGLRQRWYREWLDARDKETVDYLRAKQLVLDEVANSLQGFVNDYHVALKNRR